MANVKISELTAVTTPADSDALIIVDASESSLEKTKKITYANLKAALTGAGATYGTTGAYTAAMPTNGVAASSIIMLGTSSTIIWMYLNAAPPGWKALSTGADTVLGVSGGSGYYNVNGGNADSLASWTVSGLTMAHTHTGPDHTHTLSAHTHTGPSHTHTGPSHTHLWCNGADTYTSNGSSTAAVLVEAAYSSEASGYRVITSGGYYVQNGGTGASGAGGTGASGAPSSDVTGSGGTGNTSAASTSSVTSSGVWRPKASVGKLFQLDTA